MLSEEALILFVVAGGAVLLVLGVLEILWPTRPRRPAHRARASFAHGLQVSLDLPEPVSEAPPAVEAPPRPLPAAKPALFVAPPPPPVALPPPPPPPPAPAPPEPAAPAQAPPASAEPAAGGGRPRRRRSKVSPHARPHARRVLEPLATPSTEEGGQEAPPRLPREADPSGAEPVTESHDEARPPRDDPREALIPPPPAPAPGTANRAREIDPLLVETCFSLYQDRCYDEVVTVGEGALQRVRTGALDDDDAHEVAALWSVVALAKQAQGEDEGARVCLEAALGVAPAVERETYRHHLAALALNAAQTLVARANSHDTEDRVEQLRAALVWVECGLEAAPADPRLRDAGEQARDALWPAYEQTANRLLQRQEFETARRHLRQALGDPTVPPAWAAEYQELLASTFGGEVGQLTAQAIRSMQEERESEALDLLRRAEELLLGLTGDALSAGRRAEVDQRLWWGYTRLGMRRAEAGEYEDALDPLIHALRFGTVSADRQAETRETLVHALEGVTEARTRGIHRLCEEGDRDEAVLRTEAFRELLRRCLDLGLSEEELSVPLARARSLAEELGMA